MSNKPCKINGCDKPYYAKGFCSSHYHRKLSCGNPIGKRGIKEIRLNNSICSVIGCEAKAAVVSSKNNRAYCLFHNNRRNSKIKRPLSSPRGLKGENNHNWKGGVAAYPNHSEFKRMRLVVLKKANYKCRFCRKKALHVHHLDGTKTNHNEENLVPVCGKCHFRKYHSNNNRKSKYVDLYGNNLRVMSKKFRVSISTIWKWHKKGKLQSILNTPSK